MISEVRFFNDIYHGAPVALYFFRHRVYSADVKFILCHCTALLIGCLHNWKSFALLPFVCPETLLSWIRCGVYANKLIIGIEFKWRT